MELDVRIHWLAFTVHNSGNNWATLWAELFQDALGSLNPREYGGRFYDLSSVSGTGAIVYYSPKDQKDHYHVVINGASCDCLTPDHIRGLYECMRGGLNVKITRIDIAADGLGFSPADMYQAIVAAANGFEGVRRCAAQIRGERAAYRYIMSPQGNTFYLGSRSSGRYLRCYDQRGYTRLEVEFKEDWALPAFVTLVSAKFSAWLDVYRSLVRQFVDFTLSWWDEFISGVQSASIVISSARVICLDRLDRWMKRQVRYALVAMVAVKGGTKEFFDDMSIGFDVEKLDRYSHILQLC